MKRYTLLSLSLSLSIPALCMQKSAESAQPTPIHDSTNAAQPSESSTFSMTVLFAALTPAPNIEIASEALKENDSDDDSDNELKYKKDGNPYFIEIFKSFPNKLPKSNEDKINLTNIKSLEFVPTKEALGKRLQEEQYNKARDAHAQALKNFAATLRTQYPIIGFTAFLEANYPRYTAESEQEIRAMAAQLQKTADDHLKGLVKQHEKESKEINNSL